MQPRGYHVARLLTVTGVVSLFGLAVVLAGIYSLPPATRCLGDILQEEIGRIGDKPYAGYRCTAGAHRGDSEIFLENSLAALKAAHDNPAYTFIEFDVQFSADGRAVVFHDKRLMRLFGSLRRVSETSFSELTELSRGEIVAYQDAMAVLTDKKLNIEIKSQGDHGEDRRLADYIIADVKARGRADDVMISSISGDVILYINQTYPEIPTGLVFWLAASTYLHLDPLTARLYQKVMETRADYVLLHVANLRNIESLLDLKPGNRTIVFWDFDEAIYLVHKNVSDRLWGQSWPRSLFEQARYRLVFPLIRRTQKPAKIIDKKVALL